MPSITITIAVPDGDPTNGGDFAADLVAHVLTHYGDPTITIATDSGIGIAIGDPTAAHVATSRVLIPDFVPADRADDYIWGIKRAEAKLARYRADDRDYDRVTSMDCPFCGAVAGKPCVRASGAAYVRPTTHSDRKRAFADWETTDRARYDQPFFAVLDEVFAEYCQCGHGNEVHHLGTCVIDGCSCRDYSALPTSTDSPVM